MKGLVAYLMMAVALTASAAGHVPQDVVWTSASRNSSESMPCGGHDIGMNVWVERHPAEGRRAACCDVLFYVQQSGWFDENNTLLKAGRWRLHVEGDPFGEADFCQRLCLDDGAIYISGGGMEVRLWADVFEPVVYVALQARQAAQATLSYESWRYRDRQVTKAECQQCSYKWVLPKDCTTFADSIQPGTAHTLSFWHRNRRETVFDFTVAREQLDAIKDSLYNPIGSLLMRGEMTAPGFHFDGITDGCYASTDYRAWNYRCDKLKRTVVSIRLDTSLPTSTTVEGRRQGNGQSSRHSKTGHSDSLGERKSRERSARWWHNLWQRSWIETDHAEAATMVRNYELMRYMLACNAYGQWPTKFNGGLFTFDPVYVDSTMTFTPDYRKWGGGTMTAQNQRLVYWPMLRAGDYDMMDAQIDTYYRMLPSAIARTRHYWGHGGAAFSEQIENCGLPNPAEYGKHPDGTDPGVERNAWLEYEWDTALEFAMMEILRQHATRTSPPHGMATGVLAEEIVRFFVEHYQWQARRWSAKALDEQGRLIIYPGSACETYKMAYNPSSTIAALRTVGEALVKAREVTAVGADSTAATTADSLLAMLPEIPIRIIGGDTCIAPAEVWARIQNVETPQLYPVWPWRIYGLGRKGLQTARNTYFKDPHAVDMRSTKGWKQDNIWAACLGLTDEARRLNTEKLDNGPYRFPAFYDPGFDWAPDHNRGGAAMTGLQEMLLQESPDGEVLLFPAWPHEWNCRFRLYTLDGRVVEAGMENGKIVRY